MVAYGGKVRAVTETQEQGRGCGQTGPVPDEHRVPDRSRFPPGLAAEDPTLNPDEFGYAPLALKEWAPTPTASPTSPANVLITNIFHLSDDGFDEEHVSFVNHGDESALVTDWTLHGPGDNVFVFPTFTLGSHRAAAVWT